FVLFFFQAEDGIRDRNVTGVQTCALPISRSARPSGRRRTVLRDDAARASRAPAGRPPRSPEHPDEGSAGSDRPAPCRGSSRTTRSEERRVGKEGSSRWVAEQ